jgi:hypothetical protein
MAGASTSRIAENPLKVGSTKIKDVAVLETIKGGKLYFAKP